MYASGSNTLAKRAIGSAGHYFQVSGGVGVWAALSVTLTTQVTGILPIANGGTNISSYNTGDLLYCSATNVLSKRSIGSTGDVLTVAGGVPTWAAPSAGGGLEYVQTISGRVSTTGSAQNVASQVMNFAAGDYVFEFSAATGNATANLGYKINAGSDVFPANGGVTNPYFVVEVTLAANDDITFRGNLSSATNYCSMTIWRKV